MTFAKKQRPLAAIVTGSLFALLIITTTPAYGETHPADQVAKTLALEDGRLTVRITSTSLREVMAEVGRCTGIEVSWLGKGAGSKVSMNLSDLPVEDAVRRILRKESYALFYTSTAGAEELRKVLILPRDAGSTHQKRAGRRAPEGETCRRGETPGDEQMVLEGMEQADELTKQWAEPIAELLRNGQTAEATEELEYALARDRNPQVRLMALEGLSMLGPDAAEEMIETALDDPDPIVRAHARRCLKLHLDEDPRIREFLYPDSL